ncbi:MAG: formate dehydrogenase accessory sulfurtransferase FdhD [Polyangiaceae bacterium]
MTRGFESVATVRHSDGARVDEEDAVAAEEPLEIRIDDDVFAVTLRTPGSDLELVVGLLWSEGIIDSRDDIGSLSHCRDANSGANPNVVRVTSAPGRVLVTENTVRRGTLVSSACGVCGRKSIDDLCERTRPISTAARLPASRIVALPSELGEHQSAFAITGGVHAAGLFMNDRLHLAREDVGRHNAVDKVLGRLVLDATEVTPDAVLVVSGRAGFDIVQKACVAQVPFVVAVSAPSSMSVGLARAAGITLVGFARGGGFRVYSHPDRVV